MELRHWLTNAAVRTVPRGAALIVVLVGYGLPVRSWADDPGPSREQPRKLAGMHATAAAAKRPLRASNGSHFLPVSSAATTGSEYQTYNPAGEPAALPVKIALTSMYANRMLADRGKWLGNYGGTQRSEGAVQGGLHWLLRHQSPDGSWSPQCLGRGPESRCDQEHPCEDAGQSFAFAQTGLALLAFQGGGYFHFNRTKYSPQVRNGLDWLVEHQKDGGELFLRPSNQYMYEHGIATFALAEACALEVAADRPRDVRYRMALEKAVGYLLTQQHADGGWRYDGYPESFSDVSVSGWQMLALKSALAAGVKVPPDRLRRLAGFIHGCQMDDHMRTGYILPTVQVSEATTGVGMLLHQILLKSPQSSLVTRAAPYLARYAELNWSPGQFGRDDYYLWYNCTLAMFQAGGAPWERWNTVVRTRLVSRRGKEGCGRGSWTPFAKYDVVGGRIYTTALAVLTLEVYYRFSRPSLVNYETPSMARPRIR